MSTAVAEPPAAVQTLTIEEAVDAYEAEHGTGYSSFELGQHIYRMQEAGRLSETLFGGQAEAWHDHIRIRMTAWLRRRELPNHGVSARQFVAWATKRMAEPLDAADDAAGRRRYEWGGLAAVMNQPDSAAAAVEHSRKVLLQEVPGVVERHTRCLALMNQDMKAFRKEFMGAVAGAFKTGAEIGKAAASEEPMAAG